MADFDSFPPEIHPGNYVMKGNRNTSKIPQQSYNLDENTLEALSSMDAEALRSLIQRVSGAMWGIGLKTQEERENAILLRLSILALTSVEAKDVVASAREYFDRVKGKPLQQQILGIDNRITINVMKYAEQITSAS